MNPKKMNSTLWYSLGLVLLLCIAIPVLATGTAFARYRTDESHKVNFRVEEATKISIGEITEIPSEKEGEEGTAEFTVSDKLSWKEENGLCTLTFSVANGTEDDFHKEDQRFRLRITAGANLWGEGEESAKAVISLVLPSDGDSEGETIEGTAKAIGTGTTLYQKFGSGWVFTFLDENGEEIFWDLPGGEFSYVTITVSANLSNMEDDALIIPEIEPEIIR